MSKLLSVIVPAYNEEGMVKIAAEEISRVISEAKIDYEIVFVDDGSKDRTWQDIKKAAEENKRIHGVRFSRNFGKESAMFAGLGSAKGDCCVIIDCDLQHPVEKIIEMYHLWEQGYEVVEGVKISRGKENPFHSLAAKMFYKLISRASKIDMSNASDFKLLDRKVVDVLLTMKERHAFFRALSSWVGFKSTTVSFEVRERIMGTSKWSAKALSKYALTNISSFSTAPMQIVTILGVMMLLASLVLGVIALYQKLTGLALDGFTTVILIQLFSGSIMMISLGIIGYYIAKIYDEIKERPRYIVAERCGENADEK